MPPSGGIRCSSIVTPSRPGDSFCEWTRYWESDSKVTVTGISASIGECMSPRKYPRLNRSSCFPGRSKCSLVESETRRPSMLSSSVLSQLLPTLLAGNISSDTDLSGEQLVSKTKQEPSMLRFASSGCMIIGERYRDPIRDCKRPKTRSLSRTTHPRCDAIRILDLFCGFGLSGSSDCVALFFSELTNR